MQVASILLDNAVKYSMDGGSVLVRVKKDDGAALEVSDTGIGIPEDQLPLVFERFYRMDRSRTDGGVGLGLSIARQIAEAHGGALQATSARREGLDVHPSSLVPAAAPLLGQFAMRVHPHCSFYSQQVVFAAV